MKIISYLFLCLIVSEAFSQELRSIKGNVSDEKGPLIGVSVQIKGKPGGTITDIDGNYSLRVNDGDTLKFSYVGYYNKIVEVNNQTVISVKLQMDILQMDEVIVIGYGTQKKSDLTGSVGVISSERLESKPNANIEQALQGSIPGLNITNTGASAEGGQNDILIRGRNSINAGNGPLIVLDGVPYSGSISDINPNDIASITVLKDASSTAIYGSRGAAGVIILDTKKGEKGDVRISYNGYYGVQQMTNVPELYDGPGFATFKYNRLGADGLVLPDDRLSDSEKAVLAAGESVDWVDLTTRLGSRQDHNISVSGGSDKASYYTSLGYHLSEGVTLNDRFERLSFRVNLSYDINNFMKFGTSTQLSRIDRSGNTPDFDSNRFGIFRMSPLTTAFDENGDPTIYPNPDDILLWNPLHPTLEVNDDINTKIFSNSFIEVDFPFLEGLSYKLNVGVEFDDRFVGNYEGRNTGPGFESLGVADTEERRDENYLVENILRYNRTFGDHSLSFTGLYSTQVETSWDNDISAFGFVSDALTYYQMNNSTGAVESSQDFEKRQLLSQMGRFNYNYKSKYLLTLTARRDGYSGFGDDTKYGVFPSMAVGWNISDESFFQVPFIDFAKLRASYGINGNQATQAYPNLAIVESENYVLGSATAPGFFNRHLANPDLGWEETTTFNVGVDFGFMDSRFQLSTDFYVGQTKDLLLNRQIPIINGDDFVLTNIGEVQNMGLEFVAQGFVIDKSKFKWRFKGNAAWNRNKIIDLYGDKTDDLANNWFIGYPIEVNYGYQFDGIWQLDEDPTNTAQPEAEPGFVKIKDIANTLDDNGNPIVQIDPDNDRVIQGQRDPKVIFGLENTFSYGNLSLYVFLQGVTGVTKNNPYRSNVAVQTDVRNNFVVQEFWSPENPINDFYSIDPDANAFNVSFYEDASFMRIKDVTLSYRIEDTPLNKIGFSGMQVYTTVRNLLTFTSYGALDPELSNQFDTPLQREYVFGLKFSL